MVHDAPRDALWGSPDQQMLGAVRERGDDGLERLRDQFANREYAGS